MFNLADIIVTAQLTSHDKVWPAFQKVPRGQPFLIYCSSSTIPQWFHEQIPIDIRPRFNSLFFAEAEKHHEGIYTCHGNDWKGKEFRADSRVHIYGMCMHFCNFLLWRH